MVQQVAGAGTALITALKSQSRRPVREKQRLESSTQAVAISKDRKVATLALKNAREERFHALLTQPEVLGFLMTFAGVIASQNIPFSSNKGVNEMLQSAMTTASVVMGMGYAGVGDLTTSIVAGMAGIASLMEGIDLSNMFNVPEMGTQKLPGLTEEETAEVLKRKWYNYLPFGGNLLP